MPINWSSTVRSVQAVLDGTVNGPLTQAELSSGVIIRDSLKAAGATYDTTANDGPLNSSAYALSMQAWAAIASPAWVELDRVSRALYSVLSPPTQYMRAAFGTNGIRAWAKATSFTSPNVGVVPSSPNGLTYLSSGGTSGTAEPYWPTTIGATVGDNGMTWTCTSLAYNSSTPPPLPWDITLQSMTSLTSRASSVAAVAYGNVNIGLYELVLAQFVAFANAMATQPSANPPADTASTAATNAVNSAIAMAAAWMTVTAYK